MKYPCDMIGSGNQSRRGEAACTADKPSPLARIGDNEPDSASSSALIQYISPSINPNPGSDWWRTLGYIFPSLPRQSNDVQAVRTTKFSEPHTHRETPSPVSSPMSAGGSSGSEASSSPRHSSHERSMQLLAPPYSGAGSAGALPTALHPVLMSLASLEG